jgi:hypothetical protein
MCGLIGYFEVQEFGGFKKQSYQVDEKHRNCD